MKKSIITALMILMIITVSVIPFSVKADTTYQFDWTAEEGGMNGMFITVSGSNTINLSLYGVQLARTCKSAIVINYSFNGIYNGWFRLTFNNNIGDYDAFPLSDGIDHFETSSAATYKYIDVYVNYATNINFVLISQAIETQNYLVGYTSHLTYIDDSSNLQDVINTINTIADYNIPQRSLPAYIFASSISNPVVMNPGNYAPYIKVDANGTSRQMSYIKWASDDEWYLERYHFVVIANVVLSSSNVTSLNGNIDIEFKYSEYNFGNYSVCDIIINGKDGTPLDPDIDRLVYGRTIYLYPLFYGRGVDMPDDIRQMMGIKTKTDYDLELQEAMLSDLETIIEYLWNDQGTSNDIDDTTDAVIDLQDQEHDITDDFTSDLTDFNTNMNLNDFNFTSLFMDANNYFKNQLDLVYTESGGFQAFWVIPIILIILRILLGGTV